MATKKPKQSNKSNKAKSTKPNTVAKTEETPVSEANVDTNINETTESETISEEVKDEKVTEKTSEATRKTEVIASDKKSGSCFRGFFARKYEGKESILTVFKNHKFYGALLGEVFGTMFLTLLLFSVSLMGAASIANYSFALVAILIAVYAFSGACLNPLITVGMMATRRLSVIRGVMYIIAEIIGAWLGWLIFNSFHLAGGESAYEIPTMSEIADGNFWIVALIELFGAVVIAFFFARALKYKRSVFTFAATVAGGMVLAVIAGYVISAAFFSLNSNFIFNPAAALMYQIFPTVGDDFGQIIGGIGQALAVYALFPMVGGVCGFYLSDFTSKLAGEE